MISDIKGLCRLCNRSHELPVYGKSLERHKFKLTVHNTVCNSCMDKLDNILKNNLISNDEIDKKPIKITERKHVMIDVGTSTDINENYCEGPQLRHSVLPEEKPVVENKSSNDKVIQSPTCIRENPEKIKIQEKRNQPCFYCEYCKKKFTHTGDLNKHRRKHTGERPYDCSICNKKFSHASNLVRHKRLHSGEKPYSCPLKCGKTFSRTDKLSCHILKNHPSM